MTCTGLLVKRMGKQERPEGGSNAITWTPFEPKEESFIPSQSSEDVLLRTIVTDLNNYNT